MTIGLTASVGENNALLDGKTRIQRNSVPTDSASAVATPVSYEIWHKRLGHLGHERLTRLVKQNLVSSLAERTGLMVFKWQTSIGCKLEPETPWSV